MSHMPPLRNIVALLAWSASQCSLLFHLSTALDSAAGSGAALRRRCPARCACLWVQIAVITYKKCTHRKSGRCIFGRGRRTVSCFATPLAVPNFAGALERRAKLTAAPTPPRLLRRRRRFGGVARHAARAFGFRLQLSHTKNAPTAKAVDAFLAGAEGQTVCPAHDSLGPPHALRAVSSLALCSGNNSPNCFLLSQTLPGSSPSLRSQRKKTKQA